MKKLVDKIFMDVLKKLKEKESKVLGKMSNKKLQTLLSDLYDLLNSRIETGQWKQKSFSKELTKIVELFKEEADKEIQKIETNLSESEVKSEDLLNDETPPHIEELNEMIEKGIYAVQETESLEAYKPPKSVVINPVIQNKINEIFDELPDDVKLALTKAEYLNKIAKDLDLWFEIEIYRETIKAGRTPQDALNTIQTFRLISGLEQYKAEEIPELLKRLQEYSQQFPSIKEYIIFLARTKAGIITVKTKEDIQKTLTDIKFSERLQTFLNTILKETDFPQQKYNFTIEVEYTPSGFKPTILTIKVPTEVEVTSKIASVYCFTPNINTIELNRYPQIKSGVNYIFKLSGASIAKLWWLLTRYDPYKGIYVFPETLPLKERILAKEFLPGVFYHRNWPLIVDRGDLPFFLFEYLPLTETTPESALNKLKGFFKDAKAVGYFTKGDIIIEITDKTLLFEKELLKTTYYSPYHGEFFTSKKEKLMEYIFEIFRNTIRNFDTSSDKLITELRKSDRLTNEVVHMLYKLIRVLHPPYNVLSRFISKFEASAELKEKVKDFENSLKGEGSFIFKPITQIQKGLPMKNYIDETNKEHWYKAFEEALNELDEDIKNSSKDPKRILRSFIWLITTQLGIVREIEIEATREIAFLKSIVDFYTKIYLGLPLVGEVTPTLPKEIWFLKPENIKYAPTIKIEELEKYKEQFVAKVEKVSHIEIPLEEFEYYEPPISITELVKDLPEESISEISDTPEDVKKVRKIDPPDKILEKILEKIEKMDFLEHLKEKYPEFYKELNLMYLRRVGLPEEVVEELQPFLEIIHKIDAKKEEEEE